MYSAYKLDDYKILASGILGISVFVLVAQLYLRPVKRNWNIDPYPKSFLDVINTFVLYTVCFLAIMEATNMTIWVIKLITFAP